MTYLILITLMTIIQQGMTVPGAGSHQDEKDQIHRYRHDKRAAEASAATSNSGDRQKFAGLYTGPYFDPAMPNNISVQLGDTALLICKVNQVGRKTVSWIRKRDSHILTVGSSTFISDGRFYILKPEKRHVWTLRIRYVQPRDAGLYECQVSTEPKMSHFVQLNIVEPTVTIEANDGRIHAHQGTDVEFKCLIQGMLQKPAYVFWYHGDERLLPEYNPSMSDDVTVVSDNDAYSESSISEEVFPDYFNDLKSDPESKENSKAMYLATLKLNKVRPEQKGVYKCGPSNTRSASVELHITDGEIRAAMSEGQGTPSLISQSSSDGIIFQLSSVLWTVALVLYFNV